MAKEKNEFFRTQNFKQKTLSDAISCCLVLLLGGPGAPIAAGLQATPLQRPRRGRRAGEIKWGQQVKNKFLIALLVLNLELCSSLLFSLFVLFSGLCLPPPRPAQAGPFHARRLPEVRTGLGAPRHLSGPQRREQVPEGKGHRRRRENSRRKVMISFFVFSFSFASVRLAVLPKKT